MGSFWDLLTPPVAALLIFEVVSTLVHIFGFGGYILKQRTEFEQRFTALDLTHKAQRQQDKSQARREIAQLKDQIQTLINVIKEIKPDADLRITESNQSLEAGEVKALRDFVRQHYTAEEFALVMADFGVPMDEYQNETTIMRMDRFIRRINRDGRIEELRDRVIADRPTAASTLGVEL